MERKQILSIALELFSLYGIKKVSMDDISRSLIISKRTLYQQFKDKEALLIESLEYQDKQLFTLWEDIERGPYTALEAIILFSREIMKSQKWYTPKFYEELKLFPNALNRRKPWGHLFEIKALELLKRGVKEGVFEENMNFGIIVILAKKHIKMYCPSKSFSNYSNNEVHETIFFAFLRGICTEKGRHIQERWLVGRQEYKVH